MIYMKVTYAACISLHRKQLSCCCLWYICFCIHWFRQLDSVCGVFCLIRTSNIMQLLRDHLAPPSSEVLFQLCKVPARGPWGTIITRSLLRGWILALQEPSHKPLNSNRHNLFSWFMSPTRNMRQKTRVYVELWGISSIRWGLRKIPHRLRSHRHCPVFLSVTVTLSWARLSLYLLILLFEISAWPISYSSSFNLFPKMGPFPFWRNIPRTVFFLSNHVHFFPVFVKICSFIYIRMLTIFINICWFSSFLFTLLPL